MSDARSPLDWLTLRFRLFVLPVRIYPSFWVVSGLIGYLVISHQPRLQQNFLGFFLLWMGCCFIGFLTHELGSAIVARVFGARCTMVLGLGSTTEGDLSSLRLWQRILVHLAGPALGLCVYALVVFYERSILPQLDPRRDNRWLFQPMAFLKMLTYWYNLISLLPLLPMNGGKVIMEVLLAMSPAKGMSWAYGWSFLCCVGFVLHAVQHWDEFVMELPLGLEVKPKFTAFLFGYFALTNLFGYFQSRPPREADPPERKASVEA